MGHILKSPLVSLVYYKYSMQLQFITVLRHIESLRHFTLNSLVKLRDLDLGTKIHSIMLITEAIMLKKVKDLGASNNSEDKVLDRVIINDIS